MPKAVAAATVEDLRCGLNLMSGENGQTGSKTCRSRHGACGIFVPPSGVRKEQGNSVSHTNK